MAGYDGAGNFTRLYNWAQDKINAIKITAARMDGEFDTFATAMNQVILRSGIAPMTGNLKLGNNSITGVAAGAAATPAINFTGDATTGIFEPSAGALGFAVTGVEVARLTALGLGVTGNLGLTGLLGLQGAFETALISTTAIAGAVPIDYMTQAVYIFDTNCTANFSFNIRGNSTTALDTIMAVGEALTLVVEVPQGTTAFYCTAITVDSLAPTQVKWFGGIAPTAGNISGIDVYTITVIKKAAATFYVRASQSQVK